MTRREHAKLESAAKQGQIAQFLPDSYTAFRTFAPASTHAAFSSGKTFFSTPVRAALQGVRRRECMNLAKIVQNRAARTNARFGGLAARRFRSATCYRPTVRTADCRSGRAREGGLCSCQSHFIRCNYWVRASSLSNTDNTPRSCLRWKPCRDRRGFRASKPYGRADTRSAP